MIAPSVLSLRLNALIISSQLGGYGYSVFPFFRRHSLKLKVDLLHKVPVHEDGHHDVGEHPGEEHDDDEVEGEGEHPEEYDAGRHDGDEPGDEGLQGHQVRPALQAQQHGRVKTEPE